jgi:TolA-binding protein
MHSTPGSSLPSLRTLLGALALACVLSVGCGSQRAAIDAPVDSTSTRGPGTESQGLPAGTTLGERLGQLDARMRTAPPDSIAELRAEYDRLLAERNGEPLVVQTGGPAGEQLASDTVTAQPRRDDNTLVTSDTPIEPDESIAATTRREESIATSPDAATGDPSKLFKGLRPDEIATIPGHERAARAARSTRGEKVHKASKARSSRRGDERRLAAAPSRRVSPTSSGRAAEINARGQRQGLVAGIAAARAGRYSDAVAKLGPAVTAGKGSAEANYYYALALEKTGQTDRAAAQYLRASRGGGTLAQRSYLEYCRLLARSGERTKARQLLSQFLRRNPDSTQAVTARRLLQTL